MDETKYYNSSEVTKMLDISLRQLYYWELKGIVKPKFITLGSREFKRSSHEDFEKLTKVKRYLEQGYTLNSVVKKIQEQND